MDKTFIHGNKYKFLVSRIRIANSEKSLMELHARFCACHKHAGHILLNHGVIRT